jgi:hypothetical protein
MFSYYPETSYQHQTAMKKKLPFIRGKSYKEYDVHPIVISMGFVETRRQEEKLAKEGEMYRSQSMKRQMSFQPQVTGSSKGKWSNGGPAVMTKATNMTPVSNNADIFGDTNKGYDSAVSLIKNLNDAPNAKCLEEKNMYLQCVQTAKSGGISNTAESCGNLQSAYEACKTQGFNANFH